MGTRYWAPHPTRNKKQRTNIAVATADLTAGTCTTTFLRWHFRESKYSADPLVLQPIAQVKSWLKLYQGEKDRRQTAGAHAPHCESIVSLWHKMYKQMYKKDNKWQLVRGPLTATIATLLDQDIRPIDPGTFIIGTGPDAVRLQPMKSIEHRRRAIALPEAHAESKVWQAASKQYCGGGLEYGTPYPQPIWKAHNKLTKEGNFAAVQSLKCVVTNKSWCGQRRNQEMPNLHDGICTRCGQGLPDTPLRRFSYALTTRT